MRKRKLTSLSCAVFVVCVGVWPNAPLAAKDKTRAIVLAQATSDLTILKGRWVRPDGGYVIDIKNLDPSGKLEATYSNPNPIAVSKAEATAEAGVLKMFFELRGAGYPGSTYTLSYVPSTDQLRGIYFQAAARQEFEVVFGRAK